MNFRRPRSINRFAYLGFLVTLSVLLLHSNSSYDFSTNELPLSKICNGIFSLRFELNQFNN